MRSTLLGSMLAALLILTTVAAPGATVKFKIASQAPARSLWGKALDALSDDISATTNRQVEFKIYAGGVQGDEQAVLRKMRIRQVHGAVFVGQGLALVYPDLLALTLPRLFRDSAEFDYVISRMRAEIDRECNRRGYQLAGLPQLGFAYAFSTDPVSEMDKLRQAKPWLIEGDDMSKHFYEVLQVSPVSASVADVLTGLQSGLIRTVFSPPLGMIAMQWHTRVKYRLDTPLIYTTGVILLDKQQWDQVPAELQQKVQAVIDRHLDDLNSKVTEQNSEAIAVMEKAGVETLTPAPEMLAEFDRANDEVARRLTATLVNPDVYERVIKYRDAYRSQAQP